MSNRKILLHKNKETGIVLLEAIIAVGVLATVFTAAMSLYMGSLKGIRVTNDQLIATYLAQDAMEVMIAKKQRNLELMRYWLTGMENCSDSHACAVDFTDSVDAVLAPCGSTTCPLYVDTDGSYTTANTGTEARFSRGVSVTQPFNFIARERRIAVTVAWEEGGESLSYTLTHTIYDNPNQD